MAAGDRVDPAARLLLTAPLFAAAPGWTSRSLAGHLGCSQSAVARAWARAYPDRAAPGGTPGGPASGWRLAAAAVDPRNSLLVLVADGPPMPPPFGPFMRSPRRPPLQVLLAADLLAADRSPSPAAVEAGDADVVDADVVEQVLRREGGRAPVHVLTRRPLPAHVSGRATTRVVRDSDDWQGLLAELVRRCTHSPAAELADAEHLVMEWARSDRTRFEWLARPAVRRAVPAPAAAPAAPRALADDVLAAVLDALNAGRLAAGDRITESYLARTVHASRSHVRDALRTLAASGLVELEPNRGAVVPTPQTGDVLETYSARRALGTILVRRAAHWTPGALDPVERALAELLAIGETGNARATGDADLRFQDALAASTGMRRVPRLFTGLTAQLRLFIAVLGLDYAYSVPAMCADDVALMAHVRARDPAAAARSWQRKVDDAAAAMARIIAAPARLGRSSPGRPPGHPGRDIVTRP